jgi:ABC-type Fe3+/spermidine/putrescine transport system ATPase subunit
MSGIGLAVEGISLRLGGFALRGIDLLVANGEILVLFGPNGAGKSVTLEVIAGFHRPHAGHVRIAGGNATGLPPEARGVGLVPQNYGLFPHLTVARNVMLPMRVAAERLPFAAARQRTIELLARFGIAALAERLPGTLSPGERQRTALARALAARPRLLLFDEPFSALDAGTRESLRDELVLFLRHSGLPAVFVTHDLAEAMALADRLAVMRDGRILQQGVASDVYRRPIDAAVAALLGVENLLPASIAGSDPAGCLVAIGDLALHSADKLLEHDPVRLQVRPARPCAGHPRELVMQVPALVAGRDKPGHDGVGDIICPDSAPKDGPRTVTLAVRAEEVGLLPPSAGLIDGGANRLIATVRAVTDSGALVRVALDCGFPLTARLTRREAQPLGLAPGTQVTAEIAPAAIRVLPPG